jgi:hypothetical protein
MEKINIAAAMDEIARNQTFLRKQAKAAAESVKLFLLIREELRNHMEPTHLDAVAAQLASGTLARPI